MNIIYFVSIPVFISLFLFTTKMGIWQLAPATCFIFYYLMVVFLDNFFAPILQETQSLTEKISKKTIRSTNKVLGIIMRISTIIIAYAFLISSIYLTYIYGSQQINNALNSNSSGLAVLISFAMLFFCVLGIRTHECSDKYSENTSWFRFLEYLFIIYLIIFVLSYFKGYSTEIITNYLDKTIKILLGFNTVFVALTALSIAWSLLVKIANIMPNYFFTGFTTPVIVDLLACESKLNKSIYSCCNKRYGIDLSQSEVISYIKNIYEPTLIIALLFFWISTCVVIVPIDQECVICRFGIVDGKKAKGPGLHFKLPWPFADAVFFSPNKINVMNIGFEASKEKTDLIWSKRHSLTNDHLVVGDGVELINIDCQVLWKIKDLYKYFSTMQNPEEFIKANTYKLLTKATVTSTFDEIISRDRRIMTNQIKQGLQQFLDEKELGIEITEVLFLAIHPPLDVAASFEDVISAKLDKLTYVLKAHTENEHKIHFHRADSFAVKLKAEMNAIETIQKAEGDASSIISRAIAFNAEPDLERFRLKLNLIQKIFSTKSIYVVDKTMMRPQDTIFLNMLSN